MFRASFYQVNIEGDCEMVAHLNKEERHRIEALLKKGLSFRKVAKEIGRSPAVIMDEMKRCKMTRDTYDGERAQKIAEEKRLFKRISNLSEEEKRFIISERANGMTFNHIANSLGVSLTSMKKYCVVLGIKSGCTERGHNPSVSLLQRVMALESQIEIILETIKESNGKNN